MGLALGQDDALVHGVCAGEAADPYIGRQLKDKYWVKAKIVPVPQFPVILCAVGWWLAPIPPGRYFRLLLLESRRGVNVCSMSAGSTN